MKLFDFGPSILLTNAFILGFRHGVDWDHLAAIGDIVGASSVGATSVGASSISASSGGVTSVCATPVLAPTSGGNAAVSRPSGLMPRLGPGGWRSLYLTFLYAVGHSIVVIVLSLLALAFAAEVPEALRQGMEILVGVSLLVFGCGVAFSLVRLARGEQASIVSRWAALFIAWKFSVSWLRRKFSSAPHKHFSELPLSFAGYGPGAALSIGMLHGLGAETATQLLIIGAVGSTANQQSALALLLAFVGGFVVSNTAIAGLFSAGLLTAVSVRPLYFTLGILASIFSIVVGALYVFGRADCLPPIQHFWGSNGR